MLNEQPVLIWSDDQNKWIDTLIYFVNQPATTIEENQVFSSSAGSFNPTSGYKELLPEGSIFPNTEIWYADYSKTKKIIEKNIVWSGVVPIKIDYKLYDTDGITITKHIQDEMNYTNKIFLTTITRKNV